MPDFEKLGSFYFGKTYNLEQQQTDDDLLLYDSKDLTTHAVCVGMTGSGKTGLCLSLLEEAAIDGIPAIAIDPKGDLGNLLLTFPELRPEDFAPWVDPGEAARKGVSIEDFAAQTATLWRDGLAKWGQDGARISRFADAVERSIYTPASSAGLPLTVMRSFTAPSAAILNDADALRERITAAASSLLSLLGVDGDPLRSREHILLSTIFDLAWRAGKDLDMAALIREIQSPPVDKIGYLDLESFFPAKDRFDLSMQLNNLLASPGFAAWMEGEPLDIQRLLYTTGGKPRLSVISIAHLSEPERIFFVTILLNELISWMRAQSGTSSLRALLYMDEVFGYFPPIANPPTKQPMLTLLKQARAYGLGVVLATQNPVDLDYKGLSNAGTWFLGRLQTERDKARVLDGLEGASATAGAKFDRQRMETILSGLGNRVFLLNNVHDDQPTVFQTRWALSYLRGPLTRNQIQTLMADRKSAAAGENATVGSPAAADLSMARQTGGGRPVLPPGVPEEFLPYRGKLAEGARLVYRPALLATARVHFVKASSDIDTWETLSTLVDISENNSSAPWDSTEPSQDEPPETSTTPEQGVAFAPLPGDFSQPKTYTRLETDLKNYLYRNHTLTLWKCTSPKENSSQGETEGDFRIRLSQSAREQRDQQVEKLRSKYASKFATLQERIRKAQQRVEKEKAQASNSTVQAAISIGTTILNTLLGRRTTSSAVSRAATSMRAAGRAYTSRADIGQAEETVEAIEQQLADLNSQCEADVTRIQDSMAPDALPIEAVELKPRKSDINVTKLTLVWRPWQISAEGIATPAN